MRTFWDTLYIELLFRKYSININLDTQDTCSQTSIRSVVRKLRERNIQNKRTYIILHKLDSLHEQEIYSNLEISFSLLVIILYVEESLRQVDVDVATSLFSIVSLR